MVSAAWWFQQCEYSSHGVFQLPTWHPWIHRWGRRCTAGSHELSGLWHAFAYHTDRAKNANFQINIDQGLVNVFRKGPDNQCFRLSAATASVTTQLYSAKAATDNAYRNGCRCALIKYYLQKQVASWIWPMSHSWLPLYRPWNTHKTKGDFNTR